MKKVELILDGCLIIGLEDGEETAYVWGFEYSLWAAVKMCARYQEAEGEHETFTIVEVVDVELAIKERG